MCPLTDDPNNSDILTPGHFLIRNSLLSPPDELLSEDFQELPLTRWQMVQKPVHIFWNKRKSECSDSTTTKLVKSKEKS